MLQIKHSHHLDLPHLSLTARAVDFGPIKADNDELTVAITNATTERDDNWELSERPDMGELSKFWNDVVDDVANDPEWVKLSTD